jgi:hypothetical protein
MDLNEEDLPVLLEEPVAGGPSFLAEDGPVNNAVENGDAPLLLDSDDEVDADAEKLVVAESRVRELVERADLQTVSQRALFEQLKTELGDPELCDRHRKRLKDYMTHVAQERSEKLSGAGSKRRREAMDELENALSKPAEVDLFAGVEAAPAQEEEGEGEEERRRDEDEEDEDDFRPVKKGKKKKAKQPKKKKAAKREKEFKEPRDPAADNDEQRISEAPAKAVSSVLKAFKVLRRSVF